MDNSASSSSSSSGSSPSSPSLARSRWGLLQQAIMKKTIPEPLGNPASKRVFERYSELVGWNNDLPNSAMHVHVRVPYRSAYIASSQGYDIGMQPPTQTQALDYCCAALYPIQIYRKNNVIPVDIRNLKGFDQTGRICIWPSEQILTYWALRNRSLFEGKRVLEIGGGFHCLAGLSIAKYSKADKIVLTDGDEVNVEEVNDSIKRNSVPADTCYATTLRWGKLGSKTEFKGYFDYVIAADVVYESSIFDSLLETVDFVLKPEGKFVLFNPTRDGILHKFVKLAHQSGSFSDVKLFENYDSVVNEITWELMQTNPSFNKEWHYPIQVTFKKEANMSPPDANERT